MTPGLSSADATAGRSDPYCIVSVDDSAYRSKTKPLTLNPEWNEQFQLFVRDTEQQRLQVWRTSGKRELV